MSVHEQAPESKPLRVACMGGGPGGLFFGIAMAEAMPTAVVDVFERNRESDVFGFGVVFSDATLHNIDRVDPVLRDVLSRQGRHWDTIQVHAKGQTVAAGGNGMSAVHRRVLLGALRHRASELGVNLHYSTTVDVAGLDAGDAYDLIVACDGTNSAARDQFIGELGHSADEAKIKFIWFGTTHEFAGLTFLHEQSEHGNFAVHAYPIGTNLSTFIVETDEATWRRAGLDGFDTAQPPGPSDTVSQRYLEQLFADRIDGQSLVANNSRWANFVTRRTQHWFTRTQRGTPVAFLGDSIHTAHFSVGSGTKMAMEDAAVLAAAVAKQPNDLPAALVAFEAIQRPAVAKIQNASVPSLSWWDHFGEYYRAFEPWQFGFHFFTRAIAAEKSRKRDAAFVAQSEQAWVAARGAPPLATPLVLATDRWRSRLLRIVEATTESLQLTDDVTTITATSTSARYPLFMAPNVESIWLDAATCQALDAICARKPDAVVIRDGKPHARILCSEYLRLQCDVPTIVVGSSDLVRSRRAVDAQDCAATLVLSGRADALAFAADALAHQGGDRVVAAAQ